MQKRISHLKNLLPICGKVILAGVVAMIVLSLFCLMFAFTGIHIHNDSGATDYKWSPNQWRSTIFEGYAWLKMDENGFNNKTLTQQGVDVLLMGSSHMEAVNISSDKNVASVMNEKTDLNVYNIGVSGHTIYTCVKNMEAAVKEYKPSQYLILETSTVELSLSQMRKVLDGELATIPSYDSGVLYLMQKYVPAAKTLFKNITDWMDADKRSASKPKTEAEEDYESILSEFLKKASEAVEQSGAELIIFYHPSSKIDENGAYAPTTDENKLAIFKESCESLGIIFVDMTQAFEALYERERTLPHGFTNTAVGAGHLNEDGHRVIADTLIKTIEENK